MIYDPSYSPRAPHPDWNEPPTELDELDAVVEALGCSLADIVVDDDRTGFAPLDSRYMATWGGYDLGCKYGTGATPESAMWDLVDQTVARS